MDNHGLGKHNVTGHAKPWGIVKRNPKACQVMALPTTMPSFYAFQEQSYGLPKYNAKGKARLSNAKERGKPWGFSNTITKGHAKPWLIESIC